MYYGQVLFLHYDGTVSGCVIQEHPRFLSGSEDYPKNTDIVKIKGLSSILDIVAGPTNFLTHMDGSIYYFNKISPLPTFWKMIGVTNVTKIIYSYFDILYILNTGQVMYLNSEFCYSRLVADRKFLPELNNIKDGFIHSHPSKGLLAFFVNSEHKLILYSLRKKKIIKDAMTDGIPTASQLAEFGKCVPKRAKKLLERILADPEEFKSVITSDDDLKLLGNIFPDYPALKQPDTKAALHWLVTTKVRIVSRALWQGSIDPNCFFAKKKDRKEIPHEILIKIATHASDSAYVSEKDAEKEAHKSFCRPSL